MIYNDEKYEISKVEAHYILRKNSHDTYIEIFSNDISIVFAFDSFNPKEKDFSPFKLEKNERISLINHIFWDVTLVTKETYYLFDLTKDKIYLTRLDDNLFKLEVDIEKPDMIYCPLGKSFKNLKIDTNFSFD